MSDQKCPPLIDDVVRLIIELGIGYRRCSRFGDGCAIESCDIDWTREILLDEYPIVRFLKLCRRLSRQYCRIASTFVRRIVVPSITDAPQITNIIDSFPGMWIIESDSDASIVRQVVQFRSEFAVQLERMNVPRLYLYGRALCGEPQTIVLENMTAPGIDVATKRSYSHLKYSGMIYPRSYFDPAPVICTDSLMTDHVSLFENGKWRTRYPLEMNMHIEVPPMAWREFVLSPLPPARAQSLSISAHSLTSRACNRVSNPSFWENKKFPPLIILLDGIHKNYPEEPRVKHVDDLDADCSATLMGMAAIFPSTQVIYTEPPQPPAWLIGKTSDEVLREIYKIPVHRENITESFFTRPELMTMLPAARGSNAEKVPG